MFNHDLILLGKAEPTGYDDDDNPIYETPEREILCEIRSVSRSDFFAAAQVGLKIAHVVLINPIEYQDEERAKIFGKTYDIVRTYGPVFIEGYELLEIHLGEKVGV